MTLCTFWISRQRVPFGSSLANEYLGRLSAPHHGPEPSSVPHVSVTREQQWRQMLPLACPQAPSSSTSWSQAIGGGGGVEGEGGGSQGGGGGEAGSRHWHWIE